MHQEHFGERNHADRSTQPHQSSGLVSSSWSCSVGGERVKIAASAPKKQGRKPEENPQKTLRGFDYRMFQLPTVQKI